MDREIFRVYCETILEIRRMCGIGIRRDMINLGKELGIGLRKDGDICRIGGMGVISWRKEEMYLRNEQGMSSYDARVTTGNVAYHSKRIDGDRVHLCECGCGFITRNGWRYLKLHTPADPASSNQQWGGPSGGLGSRKKIRKIQRNRPQGWHGKRGGKKPFHRFTRKTVETKFSEAEQDITHQEQTDGGKGPVQDSLR